MLTQKLECCLFLLAAGLLHDNRQFAEVGLDLRQARDVRAAMRQHAEAGRTLLLSIHQIAEAERFCDRFVLLSNGRVCGEGTAQELAARTPNAGAGLEEVFLALT